jgi:hypothetical protein
MRWNDNTRTFEGELKKIKAGKSLRLCQVEVDCGDGMVAQFKLSIARSVKGNPQITVRTIKPQTGEIKKKTMMAVPVENLQPTK